MLVDNTRSGGGIELTAVLCNEQIPTVTALNLLIAAVNVGHEVATPFGLVLHERCLVRPA